MIERSRVACFPATAAALLWSAMAQPATAAGDVDIAFVNVNVLPMDRETVLPAHTVIVRDGTIAALGPSGAIDIAPGATRIDGGGRAYLMPGLADMHVHLRRGGASWLALFLANGVTTVLNMGGTPNHLAWRQKILTGELLGPSIYTAGPMIGRYKPLSPDEAERLVIEQWKAGYDLVKVYSSSPGSWTREAYGRVLATAKARGIPVTGHAPRNLPFDVVLEGGGQSIAHTEELLYTHFHELDETRIPDLAAKAGARGLWLITSFATFENIAKQWGKPEAMERALGRPEARYLHPDLRRTWRHDNSYIGRTDSGDWIAKALAFHFPLVRAVHRAGGRLLTGTDAPIPVQVPGFSIHREIEILTEAGLTPFEALRAATRNAGDYIHGEVRPGDRFGRIVPGYRADLLLIEGDPLQGLATLQKPLGVMARGRWHDRAALDAMLEAMAAEFAKPPGTIETASGARLTGRTLQVTLSGATLIGRNQNDTPYRTELAPDGRAQTVTGPIGDRMLRGQWWIEDDEYCLQYHGRAPLCLAGARNGDRIAWYLDVGGWFNKYYIKVAEDRLRP